ncbi:MAG TPA: heme-copper oxidase subunit III [Candidatus Binataceae bacterium]|nr:heme-copper oxidase subunit III [Candidatus Binataceae bacterium]
MEAVSEIPALHSSPGRLGAPGLGAGPDSPGNATGIASSVLAVAIFIGSEIMLFGGLLSGFIILRAGNPFWPPPGQPRLPLLVTTLNTAVLFVSAWTVLRALRAVRRGDSQGLTSALVATLALGLTFLAVQGSEWMRLIRYGLTAGSSVYGGVFYTLVGLHALHVAAAVTALAAVLGLARAGRYSRTSHGGVAALSMYWCFVVALWGVIYVVVYLG